MARKIINKTNGTENTLYVENIKTAEDFASPEEFAEYLASLEQKRNFAKEMFNDNLTYIKRGDVAICHTWEQVDELLSCFDDNDDFEIEQFEGMFYIFAGKTGKQRTQQKNRFLNLKAAVAEGLIEEIDRQDNKD
jgi:hypothetical protein